MDYKNIVVIGAGILGSQIAFQTAYCGFNVTLLIRNKDSKDKIITRLNELKKTYIENIEKMSRNEIWSRGIADPSNFNKEECLEKINKIDELIKIETNQKESLKDADLVIESITENIDAKISLYKEIAPLLNEHTVIVTNSSTILPSKLAKYTNREDKFLALHFANSIWQNNTAEVMKHEKTNEVYFNEIIEFAEKINMIPLPIQVEKSGYLLNSMLVPFLLSALDLYANGISEPSAIDKAWKIGTGAPKGPFEIIDIVGLTTAKNIVVQYQKVPTIINPLLKKMMLPYNYKKMLDLLNKYIEKGKLGKAEKEGFYKYND